MLVFFLIAVNFASMGNIERQKSSLEKALHRDIVDCYANTGRYPKTLDYIERVYGLTYDDHTFQIEYIVRGSRIPPIVQVNVIGGQK